MPEKGLVLEFNITSKIYLVINGTSFPNDISLLVHRNFHLKLTQLYRMSDGEHFEEIVEHSQNY